MLFEEAKRRVEAIDEALRAGYTSKGVPPRKGGRGAIAVAAKALGIARTTLDSSINHIREHHGLAPDWSLYQPDSIVTEIKSAPKPRVTIYADTPSLPGGLEYNVLVIGDAHDSPHIPDKSRFKWIGRYAAEHRIPYIYSIGDYATFDSCSQYDNYGTIEGRRFKPSFEEDIGSLELALVALISQFPEDYRPNRRIFFGNHENRVIQWEDQHPEVEGMMALRMEECYSRAGFGAVYYGQWHFLGGVGFTHFPMTIMGRPFGGEIPENAIANKAVFSMVIGHTHRRRSVTAAKIGPRRKLTILNVGSALPHGHIERYACKSTTGWSHGIYDLTIQANDIQSEKFISLLELEQRYG